MAGKEDGLPAPSERPDTVTPSRRLTINDIIDQNALWEARQSFPASSAQGDELRERDEKSIEYTQSRTLEGDTLVFIDYRGPGVLYHTTGFKAPLDPFRVRSTKLLATGSPVFQSLFDPDYQDRERRRRRLEYLPQGVQYVLDLTPPTEGEEAVALISRLSCPLGVRLWPSISERFYVPRQHVCGGEDLHVVGEDVERARTSSLTRNLEPGSQNGEGDRPATQNQSTSTAESSNLDLTNTPDYSILRQFSVTEKLLQLIVGRDVEIDSAVMAWTLVGLADYFDCTSAVVDHVTSWLLRFHNYCLLEVFPEIGLQMGLTLRSTIITHRAFSILVGEEALGMSARTRDGLLPNGRVTAFGRPKIDLDEDTTNVIQYASRSLNERVLRRFHDLVHPDIPWVESIPEYRHIQAVENRLRHLSQSPPETAHAIAPFAGVLQTTAALRAWTRSVILAEYTRPAMSTSDSTRFHTNNSKKQYGEWDTNEPSGRTLYEKLSCEERLFSHHFWRRLILAEFNPRKAQVSEAPPSNVWSNGSTGHLSNSVVLGRDVRAMSDDFNALIRSVNSVLKNLPASSDTTTSYGAYVPLRSADLRPFESQYMDWEGLWRAVSKFVAAFAAQMLEKPAFDDEVMATDTLLCLGPEELQFLPLWAGGNDDGSGGVTQPLIPEAAAGPSGPGPSFHTAESLPSLAASSEYDFMNDRSIVHTSVAAEDSLPEYLDDRRFYGSETVASPTSEPVEVLQEVDDEVIVDKILTLASDNGRSLMAGAYDEMTLEDVFGTGNDSDTDAGPDMEFASDTESNATIKPEDFSDGDSHLECLDGSAFVKVEKDDVVIDLTS